MSLSGTPTASVGWFARHELRLFWRDFITMLTAGKRRLEGLLLVVVLAIVVGAHVLAAWLVGPYAEAGIALDKATLLMATASLFLFVTMMVSQAMESVTRAFYARADLDLILSSPASSRRLFAVRMGAIAVATTLLTAVLAGPVLNVFAWYDGPRWLAGYGVIAALGALSTAGALLLTVALFRTLGPKRTRSVSQIVSAVIGAAFVIGIQAAAILSTGSLSRFSLLRSADVVAAAPDPSSPLWWPARAAAGDMLLLALFMGAGFGALALVIAATAGRFGEHVVAAAGVDFRNAVARRSAASFRPLPVKRALRRKEWMLIRRDPWLMSQTLMQILYLLPPALLLWRNFGDGVDALLILVPVIVMASGQLAGGLAWLAVSGEDAPDLMASAPVAARTVIAAKIESVMGAVALVAAPLLAGLAFASPRLALVGALGIAVSAGSATMVQIWFRAQAKRSNFRRRQTSSRIATLAEALSSILWAGTAALVAAESWLAFGPALFALLTLGGAWLVRPRREG
jgi:ABC-2 type transport system permease protein